MPMTPEPRNPRVWGSTARAKVTVETRSSLPAPPPRRPQIAPRPGTSPKFNFGLVSVRDTHLRDNGLCAAGRFCRNIAGARMSLGR